MTQGKIERWHRSMKNQVLMENYRRATSAILQTEGGIAINLMS